jgi:hypothetical protein
MINWELECGSEVIVWLIEDVNSKESPFAQRGVGVGKETVDRRQESMIYIQNPVVVRVRMTCACEKMTIYGKALEFQLTYYLVAVPGEPLERENVQELRPAKAQTR